MNSNSTDASGAPDESTSNANSPQPADSGSSAAANQQQASPDGAGAAAARIRIGSQRSAAELARLQLAQGQALPFAPVPPPLAPPATAESALEPAEAEPTAAPAAVQAKRPAEPDYRPKPFTPVPPKSTAPVREAKKYPPPNTRDKLSPEQEVELAEAMGGLGLDAILSGTATDSVAAELEPETKVEGPVVRVYRENVFVDLGGRRQGIVPLSSFAEPPAEGTRVNVMVSRFNAAEGLYELTLPGGAVDVADWSEVTEGLIVEARVTGHNKGGLECEVNRLRGFIPASQISLYRVEDLAQFVDQKFNCVITEANPAKGNLVLSRRAVLEREKAEAKANLMTQLEVGQVREGTVRSLQNFGAFVDLGGVDGLIHISQLSWERIKHADEVLQLGQKVKVKIQKIDPETGKIGLAFRDLADNPWTSAQQKYPARSKATGTVSRITEFGAFVRLEAGIEGLVHISELSHKRVWRASDIVQEGQEVEVLVQSVDPAQQRMSLSLKALEARAPAKTEAEPEPEPEAVAPAAPAKPRKSPLKGGIGGPSGGEKFGLKW